MSTDRQLTDTSAIADRQSPSRSRIHALAVASILLCAGVASAQDVLSLGTGSAGTGGVASVPVYLRDVSGTALGSDAGAGRRIQGIGFRVMCTPSAAVSAMSFSRTGIAQALIPLYQNTVATGSSLTYVASFAESSNPIPLTLNAAAPGDQIGTLQVTLGAQAAGSVTLTIDGATATLSNQAGTVLEGAGLATLSVVNGLVNVTGGLPTPANLVATPVSASQVSVSWLVSNGAAQYELERGLTTSSFSLLTTQAGTSFSDTSVAPGTGYVYRVRAIASGQTSLYSAIDATTTIIFTDDPIMIGSTTVQVIHLNELRTAVNAMRACAGLVALASDATVGAGLFIRPSHIVNLRDGLDQARKAIGLSALSYTDASLAAGMTIRAAHVQELRTGVK